MNKSLLNETKNGDEVMDIITRVFLYITIPSAVLIILIALWTVLLKN